MTNTNTPINIPSLVEYNHEACKMLYDKIGEPGSDEKKYDYYELLQYYEDVKANVWSGLIKRMADGKPIINNCDIKRAEIVNDLAKNKIYRAWQLPKYFEQKAVA